MCQIISKKSEENLMQ